MLPGVLTLHSSSRSFPMIRLLMSAVVLLAFAGSVQADPPKSSNDVVCRYDQQDTGSHIRHRTCETRASADERRQHDRDTLERAAASQNTQGAMSRMSKNPG